MIMMRQQVEALMQLCTAEKEADRRRAKARVLQLMAAPQQQDADPETLVRQVLLDLGSPDHLAGHCYMVEALLLCLENRMYINSITFGLYPQVAVKFDTTASRVERAMRHLIEVTWDRADPDILIRYFGNTISASRGKPTNGEFIARLTNVVRQMMKEAA